MFRRTFVQGAILASRPAAAETSRSKGLEAKWRVRGFTCVTCAVGLEVMLRQQPGVLEAHATYQDRMVTSRFDPKKTSIADLKAFIETTGFSVETSL